MTKADIVNEVSEMTGLSKVEVEVVIEGIMVSITDSLKKGDRVDLRGFGSFIVKQRPARSKESCN